VLQTVLFESVRENSVFFFLLVVHSFLLEARRLLSPMQDWNSVVFGVRLTRRWLRFELKLHKAVFSYFSWEDDQGRCWWGSLQSSQARENGESAVCSARRAAENRGSRGGSVWKRAARRSGEDGAFDGLVIVVLQLYTGFNMNNPVKALQTKVQESKKM
jgi:hypothetical protein